MKPEVKKWLIVGGLGVVSIALAIGYLQYKKIMNYVLKFKSVKIKKINEKIIDFDLFLFFTNKSDAKFTISEQEYKVYLNDQYVTKLVNSANTIILPKSDSVVGVNVTFQPKEVLDILKQNIFSIITTPEKFTLKVDMKFKVSIYGIKVSIPYTYISTIKELMAKPEEVK